MKIRIALLSLFALGCTLSAAEPTGDALLEQALRMPGNWDQMCKLPPPVAAEVPLPVYGLSVRRQNSLSKTVADHLRAHRADVVAALVKRLDAVDLTKDPKGNPGKDEPTLALSDEDLHRLTGPMISIVTELKAVETLPALLKIEDQLNSLASTAEKDSTAPVPDLPVDAIVYPRELALWETGNGGHRAEKPKANEIRRKQAILRCRVYQRELLSAMAQLLREARFQPALEGQAEQSYVAALKKEAASFSYKTLEEVPADSRAFFAMDEVQKILVQYPKAKKAEIPYTPELRAQIRGFVVQYIQESESRK
jgi:hypothetical protein